jgi:hypothetical protein
MDVIHFTLGATDPLRGFFSRNVLFGLASQLCVTRSTTRP